MNDQKLPLDCIETIKAMREKDKTSIYKISKHFGVTPPTIISVCRKHGINHDIDYSRKARRDYRIKRFYDEITKARQGQDHKYMQEIAEELGVTSVAYRCMLNRYVPKTEINEFIKHSAAKRILARKKGKKNE